MNKEKDSVEKLIDMKEKIQKAKTEKAKLDGQIEEKESQLKKEFGCSSISQGEKKLDRMEDEIEKMQKQLDKGVAELEKKYEWDG